MHWLGSSGIKYFKIVLPRPTASSCSNVFLLDDIPRRGHKVAATMPCATCAYEASLRPATLLSAQILKEGRSRGCGGCHCSGQRDSFPRTEKGVWDRNN